MIAVDEYINFLTKYELSPEQYLLLVLLKDGRGDLIQKYKQSFPLEEGTMIPRLQIKDLIDKGFLIKSDKKFKLSSKLLEIFVTPEKAVDEIYDLYPPFMESDVGVSIPLTSMDRNIFKEIYIPKIKGSYIEHIEVLKDLQYAIDNNLIKVGINKFVTSNQWKAFRKLRQPENPTMLTPHNTQDENDF